VGGLTAPEIGTGIGRGGAGTLGDRRRIQREALVTLGRVGEQLEDVGECAPDGVSPRATRPPRRPLCLECLLDHIEATLVVDLDHLGDVGELIEHGDRARRTGSLRRLPACNEASLVTIAAQQKILAEHQCHYEHVQVGHTALYQCRRFRKDLEDVGRGLASRWAPDGPSSTDVVAHFVVRRRAPLLGRGLREALFPRCLLRGGEGVKLSRWLVQPGGTRAGRAGARLMAWRVRLIGPRCP